MNAPVQIVSPQIEAADPRHSVFVTANAGSGKTSTLVSRVARLLLRGAAPEAVLCVTYTKAAAAEMQRRLFDRLGAWSVLDDEALKAELAKLEGRHEAAYGPSELSLARTLFARALETPGGLKIQTIHAFCEKLLRRFPLEAGVSPGFRVLEDAAAAEVSARARDMLALAALARPDDELGRAYAHFAVELDLSSFESLLKAFETERTAILAYLDRFGPGVLENHVWRTCGFEGEPVDPDAVEADAAAACEWEKWRIAVVALQATRSTKDCELAAKLAALAECAVKGPARFADCWRAFSTDKGQPLKTLGTKALDPAIRDWLVREQERLHEACKRAKAARVARDTVFALTLARAYAALYEGAKKDRGALDFSDLIARTKELLTTRADAAWVLYKLDGGVDHVLVDEAQDTAPEQWDILRALTGEFFAGEGVFGVNRERTLFAVGDEKQSIYSFQGAAPERLAYETKAYETLVKGAGREFRAVPLIESWRSTPEVLGFVDAVFADPSTRAAVPPAFGDEAVRHVAGRADHAGSVDLWPLFKDEPSEERDAWDAPLDAEPIETGRKRLARRIARTVREACDRGEAVFDRGTKTWRAARPGDFSVLVRKRDALFEEIIRALKSAGVPVAGADRLNLSEHIVFQDLLALGRFALFPDDDLTLAALLRSPFCDLDEQSLYDLAQPRGPARLWSELKRRGSECEAWERARELLGWAIDASKARTPFDFYGRLLSRLDRDGRSMRQRLLTRLGREADDAIDEFLAQALAAEARGINDLEGFVAAMERAEVTVKRELEASGSEARVMTVHGAKGLEAPIVILPDTTARLPSPRLGLLKTAEGGFLFCRKEADDCEASAAARALEKQKAEEEALRLLYVALTRARDRLIVAGRISARDKAGAKGCWYERIEAAFERPEIAAQVRTLGDADFAFRRYGPDPQRAAAENELERSAEPTPDWMRAFAPAEAAPPPYAPSSTITGPQAGGAPSPLSRSGGLGRFRRGDLIHRLLQILPDLAAESRPSAAERLLAKERDLTAEQRAEMAEAALGVLGDPRFSDVFGPGSRAEAAVAGSAPDLPDGLAISGRVDRMVVTPERVLIVDFKTNRPSPDRIEDADPAYLAQLAVYVAVIRAVFPGRRVEAALVWTDGPKLMPVPEALIEQSLARLKG